MKLQIGTLIDNKYTIIDLIGQGGTSYVYLARDKRLNKQWAIKKIRFKNEENKEVIKEGFLKEANLLKNLNHPLLPRIVDIITEDEDTIYVVMDYIEGNTLKKVIKFYGIQSQETLVDWAIQICNVLTYLHSRKSPIIFRDLKPANIMLTPEGNIRLIDFGSARVYKNESDTDTQYLGTEGYAAPEQYEGSNMQTDNRTDIYCFGMTLYYLFTNKSPKTIDRNNIIQDRPDMSEGIAKIILKCTEPRPENRYQSIEEVEYALQHYNEYEESYKKNQIKKLIKFGVAIAITVLFTIVSIIGMVGQKKLLNTNYNELINIATNYMANSIANDEFDDTVVQKYQEAIEIAPEREEAYLKLLDYYIRMGQTQTGLDKIDTYIQRKNGIEKNIDLIEAVAGIYFRGASSDKNFKVDYSKAAKYYSMISDKSSETKYYKELSLTLSQFGNSIDWNDVSDTLEEFKEYNDNIMQSESQIENYIALAKVYKANKAYFVQIDKNPIEKVMNILEKAEDTLTFLDDKDINDKYSNDLDISLAEIYDMGQEYDKAIEYYTKAINNTENKNTIVILKCKIADIYRIRKDYSAAQQIYETTINEYPKNIDTYAKYGMMELTELSNIDKARDLYIKAKDLSGSEKNSDLHSLEEKLKNIGLL